MQYELSDIKHIRKKLNLTQKELAKKSGVSQSLIAKIESHKMDPSFSNTKKIFETLDLLQQKSSLTAKEMMQNKIISCEADSTIKNIIKRMKRYEISQLPVIDQDKVVGVISEKIILKHIFEKDAAKMKVRDVMEEAPPIVSTNASQEIVSYLLRHFQMVIVKEKGGLKGIVTRADILRNVYK